MFVLKAVLCLTPIQMRYAYTRISICIYEHMKRWSSCCESNVRKKWTRFSCVQNSFGIRREHIYVHFYSFSSSSVVFYTCFLWKFFVSLRRVCNWTICGFICESIVSLWHQNLCWFTSTLCVCRHIDFRKTVKLAKVECECE